MNPPMKTPPSIPCPVLPSALALALALLASPPAQAAIEVPPPQVQIEAKFVEIPQRSLRELGFDFVGNYNTSISQRVLVPDGVSPQALGTFR